MAWVVEELIKNRYYIRDTDDYNEDTKEDLLSVERAIKSLIVSDVLTEKDKEILDFVSQGFSFSEIGTFTGLYRITVSRYFHTMCEKIAEYLGDYYTDEGFILHMSDVYHLSPDQVEQMKEYMNSNFKHRLLEEKYKYVKRT
jgi:hypothetical protein